MKGDYNMTMDEKIRTCYFEEGLTIGEIMSAYKLNYLIVIESIKKGPLN